MTVGKVRESAVAGSWYPARPETLRREIGAHLEAAGEAPPPEGRLFGLIAPHAGYMYSGGVAAHAYRLLKGLAFERVAVVAPSHRAYFEGVSTGGFGAYRTPLGVIPVDLEAVAALGASGLPARHVDEAEASEHALEMQLPFLQVVLGEFRLVPILMGVQSLASARALGAALAAMCKKYPALLVASTDLSHFHAYEEARRLDRMVTERVSAFDPEGLSEELGCRECEACGGGPVMAVMMAARDLGATRAEVLSYANSGDVTGDRRSVVGYMAAAILGPESATRNDPEPHGVKKSVGVDLGLDAAEKETLRNLAFDAIRARVAGGPPPAVPEPSPRLCELRGVFVTLKKGGRLRGCIGTIEGRCELHRAVAEMAVEAACSDPRFPPLTVDELPEIDLEVSVLTPLELCGNAEGIEIGRHGLVVRRGARCGLLLPQVAPEQGWDREQFLQWTCRKAGLPPEAWKDAETVVQTFSADIF